MNDQSNAFGLSGIAEQALLKLALRFEVLTGKKLNWRKNAEAVQNIIALAESHSDAELKEAAKHLRQILEGSSDIKRPDNQIANDVQRKKRCYRGVSS